MLSVKLKEMSYQSSDPSHVKECILKSKVIVWNTLQIPVHIIADSFRKVSRGTKVN